MEIVILNKIPIMKFPTFGNKLAKRIVSRLREKDNK